MMSCCEKSKVWELQYLFYDKRKKGFIKPILLLLCVAIYHGFVQKGKEAPSYL